MRLAGLEAVVVALEHDRAAVQHDQTVGDGFAQVAIECERLVAGRELQTIERQGGTGRQGQRRLRTGDVACRRNLAGMTHGPAQVRGQEGIGFVHTHLHGWRKPLHHIAVSRTRRQSWRQGTQEGKGQALEQTSQKRGELGLG